MTSHVLSLQVIVRVEFFLSSPRSIVISSSSASISSSVICSSYRQVSIESASASRSSTGDGRPAAVAFVVEVPLQRLPSGIPAARAIAAVARAAARTMTTTCHRRSFNCVAAGLGRSAAAAVCRGRFMAASPAMRHVPCANGRLLEVTAMDGIRLAAGLLGKVKSFASRKRSTIRIRGSGLAAIAMPPSGLCGGQARHGVPAPCRPLCRALRYCIGPSSRITYFHGQSNNR